MIVTNDIEKIKITSYNNLYQHLYHFTLYLNISVNIHKPRLPNQLRLWSSDEIRLFINNIP